MSQPATLYLFDSFALIFRAYFAMSKTPLINSKGFNVSAVSGFTNTLYDILQSKKPTYIACAFDAMAQTDRQAEFEFYKANRQETPEDIKVSIPIIKEIIKGFGIPILEVDGFEADDLIGTIARQAEAQGIDVYMVTPDKDMTQLVSDRIFVHKPPYMGRPYEVLGVKEVCEKWEVDHPLKVIDILGLMGDAVDNIPGVKGVGEKTAKKLIGQYGSIEQIYENVEELKGSLKDKMVEHRDMAMISKQLATIITDAPITFDAEDYSISPLDKEKLSALFADLEFRTLGKRILGESYSVVQAPEKSKTGQMSLFENYDEPAAAAPVDSKDISNTEHDYQVIATPEALEELMKASSKAGHICFDTETTGVDPNNCELVGFSFSIETRKAFYLPWHDNDKKEQFRPLLKQLLADESILKIGQNIKFDWLVLAWEGFEVKGPFFDTMLAHYVIDPETRHGMDYLAETFLGYTPVSIESLIGKKGLKQGNMKDVPLKEIAAYAAEDADVTLQLFEVLQPELKAKGVDGIFNEIEVPLMPVLAAMEKEGIAIDAGFLKEYSDVMAGEILLMQEKIYSAAGTRFNLDSPKQVGEVLFEHMKIPYSGKKTKTGQYSTNEETLQRIAGDQPIVNDLLDYRELAKLKSTYIDALPELMNPRTGRLHTTYNQTLVATGRLSSTNPNLQNIPIRTDKGREIRKAFVPRDDQHLILAADYSQIELRIVASMSRDEKMMAAFIEGKDIHAATAANVYNVPLDQVDGTMRRNAKMVNFGIIYGISAFGLAQRLGVSRTEAAALIDEYFKQYPGIKNYMDTAIQTAKEKGYAETLLGRRRYIRDINSGNFTVRGFAERNAINAPIQGTAADMIKLAMIKVQAALKAENLQSKMLLQVHDELVFDARKDEIDRLKALVEKAMKEALPLSIPIEVGIGTGNNWLEAH
jgi:DNA polymerase I